MTRGLLGMALILALSNASIAFAQTPTPPERPRDQVPSADDTKDPVPISPDQRKLERLAEVMGVLTFLRGLCPPGDGAAWRGKMQDLLVAEGKTEARRDRLAGAFNRGFDGYRITYRRCTPAAELVIARALGEGTALARDLSARFGG